MNEELQKAVTEMLTSVIDATGTASGFLQSELPDYVNQLLAWKALESGALFFIGIVLAFCLIYFPKKIIVKINEGKKHDRAGYFCILTLACFVVFVFSVVYLLNWDWVQILVAPKAYLVEYAAQMAK